MAFLTHSRIGPCIFTAMCCRAMSLDDLAVPHQHLDLGDIPQGAACVRQAGKLTRGDHITHCQGPLHSAPHQDGMLHIQAQVAEPCCQCAQILRPAR